MELSSLLLKIMKQLNGDRTIYAGLHLLRGKRSGQTLQDVDTYQLKSFFGILPKLRIERYDEAVEQLKKCGFIITDEQSFVHLTDKGHDAARRLRVFHFNGWDYRGREHIYFGRLSLVVQTVSNFSMGEKQFMPIQKDADIQRFVKQLLYKQPISEQAFALVLKGELHHALEESKMTDVQKVIFTHRLGGHNYTGWTWDQLADMLQQSVSSIYLNFIESLHLFLNAVEDMSGKAILHKMLYGIKMQSYLTDSSRKTQSYFQNGFSMEEISVMRNLKLSTIEDHFVEFMVNDRNFPLEQFVSKSDQQLVLEKMDELGTKRLRLIKEQFPALSYFQLRLILSSK